MKFIIFTFLICLSFGFLKGQTFLNAKALEGKHGHDLGIDTNGYVYTAASNENEVFLTKTDNELNEEWSLNISNSGYGDFEYTGFPRLLEVMEDGTCYILGFVRAGLAFSNIGSVQLNKVSKLGILEWTIDIDGQETPAFDIVKGNNNDLIIVGDNYIISVNLNGEKNWETSTNYTVTAICLDSEGNFFVSGDINTEAYFEKYDNTGSLLWSKQLSAKSGVKIDIDNEDNVYLAGYYNGTISFEGVQVYGCDQDEGYVAKFDNDGEFKWVLNVCGPNTTRVLGMELDNEANIYITGQFLDEVYFGSQHILTADQDNGVAMFLAKLDSSGSVIWTLNSERLNGAVSGYDMGYSISISDGGEKYLSGNFINTIVLGQSEITTSNSGGTAFIARLDRCESFNPNICMVTVDEQSSNNLIIWEKTSDDSNVEYYNIYKETNAADEYSIIGIVNSDSLSQFIDSSSDVSQQAYRYKLSAMKSCGVESEMSESHKTMHLTVNQGLNNTWNLIWDGYEGLNFGSYEIYRGINPNNMNLIASIQSNLFTFSDQFPPLGTVYYRVDIVHDNSCNPSRVNFSRSKSNVVVVSDDVNTSVRDIEKSDVVVFPNPSSGSFTIKLPETYTSTSEIRIYDTSSRLIKSFYSKEQNISVELGKGMYYIEVIHDRNSIIKRVGVLGLN